MDRSQRQEFDRMLTQPSPEEVREAARQMAEQHASGDKTPPAWWTED